MQYINHIKKQSMIKLKDNISAMHLLQCNFWLFLVPLLVFNLGIIMAHGSQVVGPMCQFLAEHEVFQEASNQTDGAATRERAADSKFCKAERCQEHNLHVQSHSVVR